MNLENAKPGERYLIWCTPDGAMTADYENDYTNRVQLGYHKIPCTIFGQRSDYTDWIIAWKENEAYPINSINYWSGPLKPGSLDPKLFAWFTSASLKRWAEPMGSIVVPVTVSSGAKCIRCLEYNEFAFANQSDGSFICYGCRT